MSEPRTPYPAMDAGVTDAILLTVVKAACWSLKAKAARRFRAELMRQAQLLAAQCEDLGNVFPINAGGLPAHLTPRARSDAAAAHAILSNAVLRQLEGVSQ